MSELFKKVYIDGKEENLPKKDDVFFCHFKEGYLGILFYYKSYHKCSYEDNTYDEIWILENIDWYLIPVQSAEQPSDLREELIKFNHYLRKEGYGIYDDEVDDYIKSQSKQ